MRNLVSNPRTVRRIATLLGKPVALVLTRGGTHHRFDVACEDGTVYAYWPTRGHRLDLTTHRYKPGVGIYLT